MKWSGAVRQGQLQAVNVSPEQAFKILLALAEGSNAHTCDC